MIYPIVIYGSQILRNESEDITPDYPELGKLIEDMWITLAEAEGVGLRLARTSASSSWTAHLGARMTPRWQTTARYLSMPRYMSARRRHRSSRRAASRCLAFTRMCAAPCRFVCATSTRTSWSTTRSSQVSPRVLSSTSTTISRVWYSPTTSHLSARTLLRISCRRWRVVRIEQRTKPNVKRGHLRPLNHCPEWNVLQVLSIQGNFFIEATANPF